MIEGCWDIHNHILPGVDDGPSTIEESLRLIRMEYEQGVRHVIFTPHYRRGMFDIPMNDKEIQFMKARGVFKKEFPDMEFHLGCEYHVHGDILEHLRDPRYRMMDTDVVLLEYSGDTLYSYLYQSVRLAIENGYRPIVAHIERYPCVYDMDRVQELRDLGAMIQINAEAYLGKVGRKAKRYVQGLLEEEMVDFIASDAHDCDHRKVDLLECSKRVEKHFGIHTARALFRDNALLLFSGITF